jgi:hypothetical protein
MLSRRAPDLRCHAAQAVALIVVVALYGCASLPRTSSSERASLAARFAFARLPLPELPGYPTRGVRGVNPSLERISAWVSSVGAAVALNDLDGDGLPNDSCNVDTRIDRAVVAPVPGTGERYAPFALEPSPLPYDHTTTAPMGCLPGDLNEDGLTDLVVYYWGRTPVGFLRRDGPLSAGSYVAREIVPGGGQWHSNAAALADLDGDGHADLIVGNYYPDGAGTLDASGARGHDMQDSMSRAYNGAGPRVLLWMSAGTGTAPDVRYQESAGVFDEEVGGGWTLAVGAADLDGDLLPELYLANDFGPDRLLHNRSTPGRPGFARLEGRRTWTTPSSKVLGRDSFKGMGVDFGDLNGDGLLDIYVSNIAAEYALQESHFAWVSTGQVGHMAAGLAPYADLAEPLGLSRSDWAWDARLADFDNDGVLEALQASGFVRGEVNRWPELQELAMGNDTLLHDPRVWPRFQPGDDLSGRARNPFFVRDASGRYVDIAPDLALIEPQVSRGIAIADVNGDGALDFAVANQWGPSSVYLNSCPRCGAFLGLHLLLPLRRGPTGVRAGHPGADTPGRPAIGATAAVGLPDGRRLVAQIDGGNGHSGKRSTDIHIGVGASSSALSVELRWRDPDGHPRQETLQLTPGWHTVVLGW